MTIAIRRPDFSFQRPCIRPLPEIDTGVRVLSMSADDGNAPATGGPAFHHGGRGPLSPMPAAAPEADRAQGHQQDWPHSPSPHMVSVNQALAAVPLIGRE